MMDRKKLTTLLLVLQSVLIILFAVFVRYDPGVAEVDNGEGKKSDALLVKYYPMFQDVHVMIFIGFGFLMTFLKRYGYGSVSFTLLLGAVVIQWATLIDGFFDMQGGKILVNIKSMVRADFAASVVLISFGAVIGKLSGLQLVIMAVIEIVLYTVNYRIGTLVYKASDLGASMFIHMFGAYFGLAVARVLYTEDVVKACTKEGAVYHSDLFSMIGTLFVWMYWPSFTSILASDNDQPRTVLNTYFAMTASAVVAVAMSSLVSKSDKLNMVHMQNATIAGGVAIGTTCNMMIEPVGALIIGALAAVVSVLGFNYLTPFLANKMKIHDTCGINDLHGLPGILAALAGIVVSGMASTDQYGLGLYQVFPARAPEEGDPHLSLLQANLSLIKAGDDRSAGDQAAWQAAALVTTLAIAIGGGIVTGFLLSLSIFEQPKGSQVFDDGAYWEMPEEGLPDTDMDNEMDQLIK